LSADSGSTFEGARVPGWRGRFFEDFRVGDVYAHAIGRTVSEADNTWFTLLTNNTHQAHFNADFAARSAYHRLLVNSCLTLSIVTGLTVSDVSENAIANLGWEDVRLPNPVYVGDTLYAESACLQARSSKSHPEAGVVEVATRGLNQEGTCVMSFRRSMLVYRRGRSPRAAER
jgi:acyl dehydratase